MSIPQGKGMFIRTVTNLDLLANAMWSAGFSWAAPFGEVVVRQMPLYAGLFFSKGISLYPCMYVTPASWRQDLNLMLRTAQQAGGRGLIVDPEAEFKGEPVEAEEMMLAAKATGYSVGVTSFGEPRFHPTFPWSVFAKYADFGLAQVYDKYGDRPESVREGLAQWKNHGFYPVMGCPSSQLVFRNDAPESVKPTELLRAHLREFPKMPGACFWPYPGMQSNPAAYPEHWGLLAKYSPGAGILGAMLPLGSWGLNRLFG